MSSKPEAQFGSGITPAQGLHRRVRASAWPLLISAVLLTTVGAVAGGVVRTPTEAALRSALANGGLVTFACDGEIALSQTIDFFNDTALDATGRSVTISGSNSVQVLFVHTNIAVSLTGLTIADGTSSNGAAVFVQAGRLTLSNVWFTANIATNKDIAAASAVCGGALYNQDGTIDAVGCTFSSNRVIQTSINGAALGGGAIYNISGTVFLQSCVFLRNTVAVNQAYPLGFPVSGCASLGGAIYNSGILTITSSTIASNSVEGGLGYRVPAWPGGPRWEGPGGPGAGGAVYNSGSLTMTGCSVFSNLAAGGPGQPGFDASYSPDTGTPIGGLEGGLGGPGQGGAIFNSGTCALVNCTIAGNTGIGGNGGTGGNGMQYYARGVLETINGADGGDGGPGFGGIFSSTNSGATLGLTNCTVAANTGTGGTGGLGGFMLVRAPGGTNGLAEGGIHSAGAGNWIINTILGSNSPGNLSGILTDLGHNLSSDSTEFLTNRSSLVDTDPALAALAQNAGLTSSMALLPGSPAIDSGDTASAPAVDQRGLPRPVGTSADIGAYEFGSPAYLQVGFGTPPAIRMRAVGVPSQRFELLASTTLTAWTSASTNQFGTDGQWALNYTPTNPPRSFYRLLIR